MLVWLSNRVFGNGVECVIVCQRVQGEIKMSRRITTEQIGELLRQDKEKTISRKLFQLFLENPVAVIGGSKFSDDQSSIEVDSTLTIEEAIATDNDVLIPAKLFPDALNVNLGEIKATIKFYQKEGGDIWEARITNIDEDACVSLIFLNKDEEIGRFKIGTWEFRKKIPKELTAGADRFIIQVKE